MSKIIAILPSGWDTKLLMDSKDFALLCDIVGRSVVYSDKYRSKTSEYVCVASEACVEGFAGRIPTTITEAEWGAMLEADKKPEEVES